MPSNSLNKGRYTKYSNKIGLYSSNKGSFIKNDTDVVLNFPFKDTVLEAGMTKEDVGRDERFLHMEIDSKDIDTLEEPKVLTDFRYIDKNGEKKLKAESDIDFFDKEGNLRQNLLIKGNNLLALHTLREKLAGKVKLIYIDPPYNTGGTEETFTYNNTFNHSTWLTFMKNRLQIARDLMREDGFIAITIDHIELFYLGVLSDEIFGSENRIGTVTIVHKPEGRNQEKFFGTSNEFMLVYAKNKSKASFNKVILDEELKKRYNLSDENGNYRLKNFIRLTDGKYSLRENKPHFYYPIYVSKDLSTISLNKTHDCYELFPITDKGVERTWKTTAQTAQKLIAGKMIVAKVEDGRVQLFEKLREDQVIKTHWIKKEYHAYHFGTKLLEDTLGRKAFSFPKSLYAVKDTISLMTKDDDIILDFFSGSGTTGHATLNLNEENDSNRKFILVEQLKTHYDINKERLTNVIRKNNYSENFVCFELKNYNQEFIEKIQSASSMGKLDEVYNDMAKNAFLKFWFDKKEFEKDENFRKLDIEERKKKLIEILDENQLYLNYADMNDTKHNVSEDEKELTNRFYGKE